MGALTSPWRSIPGREHGICGHQSAIKDNCSYPKPVLCVSLLINAGQLCELGQGSRVLLEVNDRVEGCVRLHQASGGGLGDDFRLVTFSGIHISEGRRAGGSRQRRRGERWE